MPRDHDHVHVHQWPLPDGRTATTVHHLDDDGDETVELTGIHETLRLAIEPDAGHETALPERARRGAR